MVFTLKLVFAGLIVFVPMTADDKVILDVAEQTPDHVWVLLVDGTNPKPPEDSMMEPLDPHFPALRFDEVNWLGPREPDEACDARGGVEHCRAIFIGGEGVQIVLGPSLTDPGLTVSSGNGERDFDWLIPLATVLPGAELDADSWQPTPGNGLISARLKMDSGFLETLALEGHDGEPLSVDFTPRPTNTQWTPRAVARRMVLTILTDALTFRFERLDGGSALQDLALGPDPSCKKNCQVSLELMNSPLGEVLDPGAFLPQSHRHFELFWRFVSRPDTVAVPHFVAAETGDLLCPEVRP